MQQRRWRCPAPAGATACKTAWRSACSSALMTWQHPSASMPAAAIAALAASKQGAEALEQRRSAWREAFRSLYMAVQAGACHAFYFMTPQVHAASTPSAHPGHALDGTCLLVRASLESCKALGKVALRTAPDQCRASAAQDAKKPFVAVLWRGGHAGAAPHARLGERLDARAAGAPAQGAARPGLLDAAGGGRGCCARDERMQAELREASQVRPVLCNRCYRQALI